SVAVWILKLRDGLPKVGTKTVPHGFENPLGLRGGIYNVGGAKPTALALTDVNDREMKARRFPNPARRVSDHQVRVRKETVVAARTKVRASCGTAPAGNES